MPLVQVDIPRALFEAHAGKTSVELGQAFMEALEVPASDKFQIFRPNEAGEIDFDPVHNGADLLAEAYRPRSRAEAAAAAG